MTRPTALSCRQLCILLLLTSMPWMGVGVASGRWETDSRAGREDRIARQSTVRARVQARPRGPLEEIEMQVHSVPVDPPSVAANESTLENNDLVLGVLIDDRAMAYPIRYLAEFEVVNDRLGETPLTPTW